MKRNWYYRRDIKWYRCPRPLMKSQPDYEVNASYSNKDNKIMFKKILSFPTWPHPQSGFRELEEVYQ